MWEKMKGVNEIYVSESRLEIKEVKEILEVLSCQIASLTTAKSTKPQAYN